MIESAPEPDSPSPTMEDLRADATRALDALRAAEPDQPVSATLANVTITDQSKRSYLRALEDVGGIRAASRASGIPFQRHYEWIRSDTAYAAAADQARALRRDVLEEELWRRAVEGWEEPYPVSDASP